MLRTSTVFPFIDIVRTHGWIHPMKFQVEMWYSCLKPKCNRFHCNVRCYSQSIAPFAFPSFSTSILLHPFHCLRISLLFSIIFIFFFFFTLNFNFVGVIHRYTKLVCHNFRPIEQRRPVTFHHFRNENTHARERVNWRKEGVRCVSCFFLLLIMMMIAVAVIIVSALYLKSFCPKTDEKNTYVCVVYLILSLGHKLHVSLYY